MPENNLDPDQPKKQTLRTKTKINVGVAISIAVIGLTLLFTGSMFLLAGSWSLARLITTKSKTRRASYVYRPRRLNYCDYRYRRVTVPDRRVRTVEEAIRIYGSRPLIIRNKGNFLVKISGGSAGARTQDQ